jgi:transposase-like protein
LGDASEMDGSAQSSSKSEGVRAKRRKWSIVERQRIVQASLKAGTTVDAVARVYGVNASQIYDWRKQHRQRMQEGKPSVLLPVHVAECIPAAVPEAKQHPVNRIAELLPWNMTPSASLVQQRQSA